MTGTGKRIFHLAKLDGSGPDGAAAHAVTRQQYERHGFVHCCTREQILEVAQWWLSGQAPLAALEFEAETAGDVRFERADLGRRYPHVYNPLPAESFAGSHPLDPSPDAGLPRTLSGSPVEFLVQGGLEGRQVAAHWRGGRLVAGDPEVIARAEELAEKGVEIPQFPGVSTVADLSTPYAGFCVLAAVLDRVDAYYGDGFVPEAGG